MGPPVLLHGGVYSLKIQGRFVTSFQVTKRHDENFKNREVELIRRYTLMQCINMVREPWSDLLVKFCKWMGWCHENRPWNKMTHLLECGERKHEDKTDAP